MLSWSGSEHMSLESISHTLQPCTKKEGRTYQLIEGAQCWRMLVKMSQKTEDGNPLAKMWASCDDVGKWSTLVSSRTKRSHIKWRSISSPVMLYEISREVHSTHIITANSGRSAGWKTKLSEKSTMPARFGDAFGDGAPH